jgi:predicted nucleotidyltransferase
MMKTINEIKKILEFHKGEFKEEYGVKTIGIFGSYLRKEQTQTSDIDVLVEFEKSIGLMEFVGLKNRLSDLLEMKVDLVMKKALKPGIGRRILSKVVYV